MKAFYLLLLFAGLNLSYGNENGLSSIEQEQLSNMVKEYVLLHYSNNPFACAEEQAVDGRATDITMDDTYPNWLYLNISYKCASSITWLESAESCEAYRNDDGVWGLERCAY